MKKLLLLIFTLLTITSVQASPPSRLYSYTNGQTIVSDEVTENEDLLFNYLRGGVDAVLDGSIVNADVNASANIQAEKLNLTAINQNIANTGTLTNTGTATIVGTLTATDIQEGGANLVPQGVIVMWSGAVAAIPTGWELCDGTCTITCPDLRNNFVIGAGDTYAVDATGGATTHTLLEAEMPSHTHSVTILSGGSGTGNGGNSNTSTGATGSTGSGTAFSILNPYYALAFIIKN